jgi:putative membrane protein insertion efficiency factor
MNFHPFFVCAPPKSAHFVLYTRLNNCRMRGWASWWPSALRRARHPQHDQARHARAVPQTGLPPSIAWCAWPAGQQQGWTCHHCKAESGLRVELARLFAAQAPAGKPALSSSPPPSARHENRAPLPAALLSTGDQPDADAELPLYPSCSNYALEALQVHGAARGSLLAAKRICRCHPWNPGGHDPVPPAEIEFLYDRLRLQPLLIEIMDINKRTILWIVFAVSLFVLWNNWQISNGHPSMFAPPPPQTAKAPEAKKSELPAAAAPLCRRAAACCGTPAVPNRSRRTHHHHHRRDPR